MKKIVIIAAALAITAFAVYRLAAGHKRLSSTKKEETVSAVSVKTIAATRQKLDRSMRLVGTLYASKELSIAAEMPGKITSLDAEVGQRKQKGQVIATIDSKMRQLAVETAKINFQKWKKDTERYENLFAGGGITQQQLDDARNSLESARIQLEQAQKQLADATISAPISGTITVKNTELGAYVNTGAPLAYMVDVSTLKVKINVSEGNVYQLKTGDEARITADAYPGVVFNGKISYISPQGDEAHNYPVEIILTNSKEHELRAGTFVNVGVELKGDTDALCIPRTALLGSTKDARVYIVKDGRAELRSITIISQNNETLAVGSGLAEGDAVVTAGQINLEPNMPVSIIGNK